MNSFSDTYNLLIAPYTQFCLKLFKEVARQAPDKNVVVSPMSVAIALAMTCNGAVGDTQSAIRQVLELNTISLDTLNSANAALLADLQRLDPHIALTLSNRIQGGTGMALHTAFLQTNQQHYHAEIMLDADDKLVIANRIHFKGAWREPFDYAMTTNRLFTLPDGTLKMCAMLNSRYQDWAYYHHARFEVVRLPYGEGRASLYLFLSNEDTRLAALMQELTFKNWNSWLDSLVDTEGAVVLPRFAVEAELALHPALESLGMGIAFDPQQADFGALCASPAFIHQVNQQVRIEVTEEGTTASAETVLIVELGGIPPEKPTFYMVVDRPFLYAIRDDRTGMLLFLGITADPEPLTPAMTREQYVDAKNFNNVIALAAALEVIKDTLEQGAGFSAALGRVYEQYDNDLAQQFGRVLREIQLGMPRSEALRAMAHRMAVPELTDFIEAILQADQVGERLIDVAQIHAERLRSHRSNSKKF